MIKPGLLQYEIKPLNNPITYNSLGGPKTVDTKIITPIPIELKRQGTLEWKIFPLKSEKYDAIMGQNFLIPFEAVINMKEKCLFVNGNNQINFENFNYLSEIAEANHLYQVNNFSQELISKINENHLNSEEKKELKKLLENRRELFYLEGDNLTFTHEIQHEIHVNNNNPTFCKIYRYPQIHEKEVDKQIREMLDQKIIRKSNSPYNSPLWIVPKKSDNSNQKKWRIVIDYRKLNENTIADKFPIPNIDTILDKVGRAQYFTTIDLAKGFHQILVREEDRKKTAFSTPFGHYEYNRMPFGLKNAPASFQRLINSVLREYINKKCVVYLDDILIFSTSLQEHIQSINQIFDKLQESNLKIQVDKCNFLCKETEYLGHILTSEGIKPNPNKIKSILELKLPNTEKKIKSFLGITGYYRKFIKDYARVAQPITKYLKKNVKINLNDPNYIAAFEKLKSLITDHPVLNYPDFNKRFKIVTDASNFAIGAVLMQEGHPVSYASRTLNNHEINYPTIEKELLAIVWATKYYRPYIFGREFDLLTDHEPIKWLHKKHQGKDINQKLIRWLIQLNEYDINIDHIKGKENRVADFLSRINVETREINQIDDNISEDSMEVQTVHSQEENSNDHFSILDTIVNRFKIQIILVEQKSKDFERILNNNRIYIEREDIPDNLTNIFNKYISKGKIAIYSQLSDSEYNIVQKKLIELFHGRKNTKFVKCSHFAKDIIDEEETLKQISLYHKNESIHSGIVSTYQSIKNLIYHPNLKLLIYKLLNNCDICNRAKYDRKPIKNKFMKTETASDVAEIVHADTYTNSKHSFINFIDKFSKHAISFYLEDRNAKTLIEKINLMLSIKGKIKKLVCDNEFNTINIKEFCRQKDIQIHFSKPNSHTGNSDIERFNNTLTEKIRILNLENKQPIKDQITKAVESYNNTYHSTIKAKPIDVEQGKIDKDLIRNRINKTKEHIIEKLNKSRENYSENRTEGYVKNYKSVRHKEEPKFRKNKLDNIHPNNIKRNKKFQLSNQAETNQIPSSNQTCNRCNSKLHETKNCRTELNPRVEII